MQIANYWRAQDRVRNVDSIDNFVRVGYERLYNIQQGDIWGTYILDMIAPQRKEMQQNNIGYNTLEDDKYEKKSDFLKNFYQGERKPDY